MVRFLLDLLCIAFDDDVEFVCVVIFFENERAITVDFIAKMMFGKLNEVVEVGGFIKLVAEEFVLFEKKRKEVRTLGILKVFWVADNTGNVLEKSL